MISPTTLDFGQVRVGATSVSMSATVRNVSDAPIVMSGSGGGTSSPFTSSNDCDGKTLLVNATCHMVYRFKPTDLGTATGSTTGEWNGQSYTINLTGVGSPRFAISQTGFDFGDVPLGTTGPTQTVTITNMSSPVVMSGAGGGAGQLFGGEQDCEGKTLGTGKSCHMFYRYAPSALGAQTGSTTGHWNGQPFTFTFAGNGVPLPTGDFIPVQPQRVLDTTTTTANQELGFAAAGFGPAPTNAAALDVTVTALSEAKSGSLTVWPCSSPKPSLPNLHYAANKPVSSHVLATFDSSGLTCVQATTNAHVRVDMDGYYSSTSSFHAVPIRRLRDTRTGARPAGGRVLTIAVTGNGVPADAAAVALDLTALDGAGAGHLTAFPCGSKAPTSSALEFQRGAAEEQLVVSKVGSHGDVCIRTSAPTHVLVDVTGYYTPGSAFTALAPRKIIDTAAHIGYRGSKPRANQVVTTRATGGPVPGSAKEVVLEVTSSAESRAGTLSVWGCGQTNPQQPAAQFGAGQQMTTLAVSRLFAGGKVCLQASRSAHLTVNVVGWYS